MAFEVVSTQNLKDVTEKAPRMLRRGVRRVFAVFLKKGKVREWSVEKGTWIDLDPSSVIADRCLIEPLEVKALLDAAAADDAVASALVARGNPVIEKLQETKRAEGKAEAVLEVLEARDLLVSDELRQRILRTTDPEQLRQWLKKAALIASADELEAD